MTRTLPLLALAAAAALAGCNRDNEGSSPAANDEANAVANAKVELPPAIAASKTYRCKDNSLVYIDWLADKKTANFRTDQTAAPVQLKAPEEGQPLVAEGGYSLTGAATDSSITLAQPGKSSQSCKA